MKRIFFVCVLFLLVFFSNFHKVAALSEMVEEIRLFDSQITVQQNTAIAITETIRYYTKVQKHGIYRYIPIVYSSGNVQRQTLRVSDISVTDEHGKSIPFSRSQDGAYVNLKIGDPNSTFTGEKTYVLSYLIERAIDQYESHAELYWDITGEGWQVLIASATATVMSPFATVEKVACYTGVVGTNNGMCTTSFDTQTAHFVSTEKIGYGDNFTIVVGFSKESGLVFPSQQAMMQSWFFDNWILFLLPLPSLVVFIVWWKKGRDYQFVSSDVFNLDPDRPVQHRSLTFKARVPFVYEPLMMLSPGEAGALIDGRVDTQDIVAEILELARKKYLSIEQVEKKKLFFTSKDYTFTKLQSAKSDLPPTQSYLLGQLFKSSDVVALSKLRGTFYQEMAIATRKLSESLEKKGVYQTKPNTLKALAIVPTIVITVLLFSLVSWYLVPLGIQWPLVVLVLQLGGLVIISALFAQKSAVGTNLWLQARGLRQTISHGKWREEVKEKHLFIEEILPFAVALGVVKKLTKDMEDLNINPPEYLSNVSVGNFAAAHFISDFSSSVGQNLTYNPNSSSRSGGSGFSSGGSSGGGGGGGGGGSW